MPKPIRKKEEIGLHANGLTSPMIEEVSTTVAQENCLVSSSRKSYLLAVDPTQVWKLPLKEYYSMATTVIILAVAIMGLFPKIQFSIFLRKMLVEKVAEKLSALTITRIVFLSSLVLMSVGMLYYSKGQAAHVLAVFGAEALPWFVSFDLLTFVDVLAVLIMLRLALHYTTIVYSARSFLTKLSPSLIKIVHSSYMRVGVRRRTRPNIRKASRESAANDDDGPLRKSEMAAAAQGRHL